MGTEPHCDLSNRDIENNFDFYVDKGDRIIRTAQKRDTSLETLKLCPEEVVALRLWTGPMHQQYAKCYRDRKIHAKSAAQYATTLHAINSGITKLARIWRLPVNRRVFRGYRGMTMNEEALRVDGYGCKGGVDCSVLATTLDCDVALAYSGQGSFILEIEVGQVDRGADIL